MIIKTVTVLLMLSNSQVVEHRLKDNIGECLKSKRVAERNIDSKNISFQCLITDAELELNVDQSYSVKKIILDDPDK